MKASSSWRFIVFFNIVAGMLLLTELTFRYYADEIAGDYLKQTFQKQTKGKYQLQYDDWTVGLLGGNTSFENLQITPVDTLMKETKAFIKFKKVALNGLSYYTLITKKGELFNSLKITKGWASVFSNKQLKSDTAKRFQVPAKLQQMELGKIEVDSVQVRTYQQDSTGKKLLAQAIVNVSLQDIAYHNEEGKLVPFLAKGVEMKANDIMLYDFSDAYTLSVDSIGISTHDSTLWVNAFALKPIYGEQEHSARKGISKDRIDLELGAVRGHGVEVDSMLYGHYMLRRLELDSVNLQVFKNKQFPVNGKFKKLPQQLLRELKSKVRIDTLQVRDTYAAYEELTKNSSIAGKVFFTNLQLTATNVSNIEANNPVIQLDAKTRLMGEGTCDIHIQMPVYNPENRFEVKGTLGSMDLKTLNRALNPLAMMEVEMGSLHKMDFGFSAVETVSNGWMDIQYENLKVKLLRKKDKDTNKFLTKIANIFVKKDKEESKHSKIKFKRDQSKSFLNYCWKSILSGIKDASVADLN
ncbi:hypothetical protein V6R21_09455 [Limibacter armeniacum]|uniref:hypothetical protein n=1 Tax=Limibacter armeniacum TaxID=466084 RepID=UPI002FE541EC